MNPANIPDFLKRPAFWFSLVNAVIVFLPRFGVTLDAQEIAAVNLVIAAAFNVVPPVNGYVAAKRYELAAKSTPIKLVE